jgi:OST-HTH/LOTUS domain
VTRESIDLGWQRNVAPRTERRTERQLRGASSHEAERAFRLSHEKDDADWLQSSTVKSQMRRMDPSFSEKALGYRSFSDFVKSREAVAELDESNPARLVRLNPAIAGQ